MEKISIENAPPGNYKVRVRAQNTILLPQGYSLTALGRLSKPLYESLH